MQLRLCERKSKEDNYHVERDHEHMFHCLKEVLISLSRIRAENIQTASFFQLIALFQPDVVEDELRSSNLISFLMNSFKRLLWRDKGGFAVSNWILSYVIENILQERQRRLVRNISEKISIIYCKVTINTSLPFYWNIWDVSFGKTLWEITTQLSRPD